MKFFLIQGGSIEFIPCGDELCEWFFPASVAVRVSEDEVGSKASEMADHYDAVRVLPESLPSSFKPCRLS